MNDLKYLLPQEKKENISSLKADELIHMVTQTEIVKILANYHFTFLFWKFSAGLYYLLEKNEHL